jgi:hypothetical protein
MRPFHRRPFFLVNPAPGPIAYNFYPIDELWSGSGPFPALRGKEKTVESTLSIRRILSQHERWRSAKGST